MERTPLHDLSRDELIGLTLRLQKELADLEKRNAELAARNEELSRRIEELGRKIPRYGLMKPTPCVSKRCEFGQEICITLAHQHYIIGLSLDKAIAEIEFFWGLKLRKSPADAMLNCLRT